MVTIHVKFVYFLFNKIKRHAIKLKIENKLTMI